MIRMGRRLTVVGAEDVLDEDGLLVVGQVGQELTEGLGGMELAHWLHYSHHVNLTNKSSRKSSHVKCEEKNMIDFDSEGFVCKGERIIHH